MNEKVERWCEANLTELGFMRVPTQNDRSKFLDTLACIIILFAFCVIAMVVPLIIYTSVANTFWVVGIVMAVATICLIILKGIPEYKRWGVQNKDVIDFLWSRALTDRIIVFNGHFVSVYPAKKQEKADMPPWPFHPPEGSWIALFDPQLHQGVLKIGIRERINVLKKIKDDYQKHLNSARKLKGLMTNPVVAQSHV